jgi:MFS family permease
MELKEMNDQEGHDEKEKKEIKKLQINLWKYLIIKLTCNFSLISAIYILYFQYLDYSFKDIGLYEGITSLTILLFELPSGILADQYGRKWLIFGGNLAMIGLACLFGFGSGGLFLLLIISILNGSEFSFRSGSDIAFLYDNLVHLNRDHEYIKIKGRISAISMGIGLIMVILGGLIFTNNPRLPYWIWIGMTIVGSFFTLLLYEPKQSKTAEKPTQGFNFKWKSLGFSIRQVFHTKLLLWLTLFGAVSWTFFEGYADIYSQAHLIAFDFPPAYIGFFFAGIQIVSAIVAALADKIHKILTFNISTVLIFPLHAIMFVILAFATNWLTIALCFLILQVSFMYYGLISDNKQNQFIPSENRASILSAKSFLHNGLFGGGVIIWVFGLSLDKLTPKVTLILSAGIVFVGGCCLLFWAYRSNIFSNHHNVKIMKKET